jgi:hypothetical protein
MRRSSAPGCLYFDHRHHHHDADPHRFGDAVLE